MPTKCSNCGTDVYPEIVREPLDLHAEASDDFPYLQVHLATAKQDIMQALAVRREDISKMIEGSLDHALDAANIRQLVRDICVSTIKDAIKNYFETGYGREYIDVVVETSMTKLIPLDPKEYKALLKQTPWFRRLIRSI